MAIASKERIITFAIIGLCIIIGAMVFIAVVYQGQANGMQSNFNTEKAYLQSSIDQLQNEKTSLEGQLSSLNAQVASLNNQVSTLNGQVSTLITENAKLTAQVTDLKVHRNEAANARIKTLQSIIERLPKWPIPV
jgi:peptidoglycan hydrolase CwlO-like protein